MSTAQRPYVDGFVLPVPEASLEAYKKMAAVARHWNEEDKKSHEAMGFHDGWGKAADQLAQFAQLAATL